MHAWSNAARLGPVPQEWPQERVRALQQGQGSNDAPRNRGGPIQSDSILDAVYALNDHAARDGSQHSLRQEGQGAPMVLETQEGPLYYQVDELTPPWVRDPPTIVFCHGVAVNCDIWAAWLPLLAPRFRIVRFDTRGFGRSIVPGRKIDWRMDLLADDILGVARATGTERFHLVGESMGGTVCLHLACRPDAPLLSLTCASTAHRGGSIRRVAEWRDFVAREGIAAWSAQMMERRFYPGALSAAERNWFDGVQQRCSADSLLDAADMLVAADLTDDLRRITAPTLLLCPDDSPFVSLDLSSEIHRLIAHSEMAVFPGARHGLPFSHAKACAETLLAFIDRHVPSAPLKR